MGAIVTQRISRAIRNPVIIGVDGGGTNFRVRAYPFVRGRVQRKDVFDAKFKTADYARMGEIIAEVFDRDPKLSKRTKGVGLGIAGAFDGNKVKITNSPNFAEVNLGQLADAFGFQYVGGVNDLEATAYGVVAGLDSDEKVTIHPGVKKAGNQAVIAPGTGLGEAIILDGKLPIASEGGHSDFAPVNHDQIELLKYLQKNHPDEAICYEDVLSGEGLVNIVCSLCETGYALPDFWLTIPSGTNELPAKIAQKATEGTCVTCMHALHIFISVLAQEASNLALKSLSTGGVYIGGTASQNLPFIQRNHVVFNSAFDHKRKQKALVKDIPVSVITKEDVNEFGAAYFVSGKIAK